MQTHTAAPVTIITLLALFGVTSCTSDQSRPTGDHESPTISPSPSPSSPAAHEFRGTLRSGFAAIGGETTGWLLSRPRSEGGDIEVDVTAAQRQANTLDGKPCIITGRVTDRQYVERGTVKVLIAEQLRPTER